MGVSDIGLGIALQLVVAEVALGMHLLMTTGIALETVIGTLMTVMMVDGMEIGAVLTAETTNMGLVIAMLLTDTHHL